MNAKLGSTIVVLFALAMSLQTLAEDGKSSAQQEFEEDPNTFTIEGGQLSRMIELANNGLDLVRRPVGDGPVDSATNLFNSDAAQKDVALELLLLRNRLLSMKLVKPSELRSMAVPAWIFEPPTSKVSPDTLQARRVWISTAANKLVEVGCNVGRQKKHDDLFCSVE